MSHQSVFILPPTGVFLYHSIFFPLFLFNGVKTVDEMLKLLRIFSSKKSVWATLRVWFQCKRGYLGKSAISEQFSEQLGTAEERWICHSLPRMGNNGAHSWPRMFFLFPFSVLSFSSPFFERCLFNFVRHHFVPKIVAIMPERLQHAVGKSGPALIQPHLERKTAKLGQRGHQDTLATQVVQSAQAALSQLHGCGSEQWSSQKTRIQGFNEHCPSVNGFLQGTAWYPKPGGVLALWNARVKIPAHKARMVTFWEEQEAVLQRQQGLPLPWGQPRGIGRSATGQLRQFAVLPSFTLLIMLDEKGFVHITTAKAAAACAGLSPANGVLKPQERSIAVTPPSVPPAPTNPASNAWPPVTTQSESKKHTSLMWTLFLIMFYTAE